MTVKRQIRNRVSDIAGAIAQVWPFSNAASAFFAGRCNVIFYHAVWRSGDPRLRLFGGVETDTFAADLRRLEEMFRFAPLNNVLENRTHSDGQKPALCITFDDGFDLINGGAADILENFGIPATVFVNSDSYRYERILWQHAFGIIREEKGEATFLEAFNANQSREKLGGPIAVFCEFIDATKEWPQHRINEFSDTIWACASMPDMSSVLNTHKPYMDIDTLKMWRSRGHDVGFHSKSHPFSSSLDPAYLDDQFFAPARELKLALSLDKLPFAYPFGDRLPQDLEKAVIDSGIYSCLLGTDRLSRLGENPNEIDRIEVDFGLNRHFFGEPLLRAWRGQDDKTGGYAAS